jgi:hypothetical protein
MPWTPLSCFIEHIISWWTWQTQWCQIINDDAKRNHKEIARFSNDGITRLNYNLYNLIWWKPIRIIVIAQHE